MISGNRVVFRTGLCVLHSDSKKYFSSVNNYTINFRDLDDNLINSYLDNDDVLKCAASIRIEGAAINLVKSMKSEVLVKGDKLNEILDVNLYTYDEAIKMAFIKIEQNSIISSWKDSLVSGLINNELKHYIQVPKFGILQDKKIEKNIHPEKTLELLWKIGGDTGWYYANFLWKIRGYLDQLSGGVGLRRGRTHNNKIFTGDSLDFWRVLLADKKNMRLLLFAEMKLPGEAWLEFKVRENQLTQTATFRPRGIWGRLYWYSVFPLHGIVFGGMIKRLANK